jgi:hypothetical protein
MKVKRLTVVVRAPTVSGVDEHWNFEDHQAPIRGNERPLLRAQVPCLHVIEGSQS